jgi:hypothetical protein
MMRRVVAICLVLVLVAILLPTRNVRADSDECAAILAVMQRAFDAVHSQDPDDWRAIQLAEGTTLSFRPHPDGEPGELQLRLSNNEDFISNTAPNSQDYIEQWTGDPIGMIRGPIAVVWGEYEFLIDGQFSHCGVDSTDLVKIDGQWKIANFMWTVERGNCPTGPTP